MDILHTALEEVRLCRACILAAHYNQPQTQALGTGGRTRGLMLSLGNPPSLTHSLRVRKKTRWLAGTQQGLVG